MNSQQLHLPFFNPILSYLNSKAADLFDESCNKLMKQFDVQKAVQLLYAFKNLPFKLSYLYNWLIFTTVIQN